ncbi:hypothetical protein DER46DRAFT_571540 [Fusarium sp. MPI-SDFR-AT-0072]|nr:hypothetical protein DER46DRAFT_571540 [Fusarium sp. MPI-SDFR-AT-0072]
MPTLIEGNIWVIEGILQPLALLMHRYDGTTMRDSVYEHMILNKFDGAAQERNPRESIGILSNVSMAPNTINTTSANTFMTASKPIDMITRLSALPPHGPLIDQDAKNLATHVFQDATAMNSSNDMVDVVDMGVIDVGIIKSMVDFTEPATTNYMIKISMMMLDNLISNNIAMERQAVEGNFAVGVHYQAVYGKTVWEPPLGRLNSLYQHRLGQEFMVVIHTVMGNQYYIFLLAHTVYRPPDVLTHSTYACRALTGLVTTSMYRNGSSFPISRLLFFLSIVSMDEVFMIAVCGRGGNLVVVANLSDMSCIVEFRQKDLTPGYTIDEGNTRCSQREVGDCGHSAQAVRHETHHVAGDTTTNYWGYCR